MILTNLTSGTHIISVVYFAQLSFFFFFLFEKKIRLLDKAPSEKTIKYFAFDILCNLHTQSDPLK